MAITKILNIQESEGRNPATHLKNALEYIQNPDRQKNVYWLAVSTACQTQHLSRWKRQRIYFIKQVKGRAIM